MKPIALTSEQAVWDCRWSRPGPQLVAGATDGRLEITWACVRDGYRRPITPEECGSCLRWQRDHAQ